MKKKSTRYYPQGKRDSGTGLLEIDPMLHLKDLLRSAF